MNYMWDDLVPFCITATATVTPANCVQQRERRPGLVCCSASRNAYDAEVRHRGKIFDYPHPKTKEKMKEKDQLLVE